MNEVDAMGRVHYPFPLSNGRMAYLVVPAGPLGADDADRMVRYIEAVCVDFDPRNAGITRRGEVDASAPQGDCEAGANQKVSRG